MADRLRKRLERMALTPKQREVLLGVALIRKGQTLEDVGTQLNISGQAVRSQMGRIKQKYRKMKRFATAYEELSRIAHKRKYFLL